MLRTFRLGGIHPPENKLSAKRPIEELPLPREVIIPIGQHIGAPATPTVQKGDLVKVGTIIAKTSGFVSANIHSSVTGKVTKIDSFFDAGGYKRPAILFALCDGDDDGGAKRSSGKRASTAPRPSSRSAPSSPRRSSTASVPQVS